MPLYGISDYFFINQYSDMRVNLTIFCAFLLLFCCAGDKSKTKEDVIQQEIITLDLTRLQNMHACDEYFLSESVDKLDIVFLELTNNTLISNIFDIKVTEKDIFVCDYKSGISRFDHEGRFLNKIGRKGQGPGEYQGFYNIEADDDKKYIYFYDYVYSKIFKFNFEGEFINDSLKRFSDVISGTNPYVLLVNDKLFLIDLLPVIHEREKYFTFALFDDNYQIKKYLYNPELLTRTKEIWENRQLSYGWKNFWTEKNPSISVYDKQFMMSFYAGDTIYRFDLENECFTPLFILRMGDKPTFEESHQWIKDDSFFDHILLLDFLDTQKYIYFYLFKSNHLYILKYEKENGKQCIYKDVATIDRWNIPGSPSFVRKLIKYSLSFKNDFCGGSFSINYRSTGKYWVSVLFPEQMKEIKTEEIGKEVVKDQNLIKEYLRVLENIREDDNPILLIATLK